MWKPVHMQPVFPDGEGLWRQDERAAVSEWVVSSGTGLSAAGGESVGIVRGEVREESA